MKEEIWKTIPGFSRYKISNYGNIKSYARKKPRLLKQAKYAGYKFVNLTDDNGKKKVKRTHTLVMLAFVGPRPGGLYACHINDIKDDNRLENLKYATQKENQADARRNNGGISKRASLTVKQVKEIIRDLETLSVSKVAEKFGATQSVIRSIASGTTYSYIPRPSGFTIRNLRRERAEAIRGLYLTGNYKQQQLADIFQMSVSGISRIVNYQRLDDKEI